MLGQRPGLPLVRAETDPGAEFLIQSSCRAARTRDVVRAEECDGEINGTRVQGTLVRRFRFREVQNDPDDEFRIIMVPVGPGGNGELGVIVPAGDLHPDWEETSLFCEGALPESDAPVIPDPVEDPDTPDCRAQWGGRFDQGSRTGYVQTITYPEGWPINDVVIRSIDDDCFRRVAQAETQTRNRTCPAGHSGEITESRTLGWWNRIWAVLARHDSGTEGSRRLAQAARDHDANPSQAGLTWLRKVTASRWRETSNTCRAQCRDPHSGRDCCEAAGGIWERNSGGSSCTGGSVQTARNTGGNEGGNGGNDPLGSFDTDGDGRTDSRSPSSPTDGYSRSGIGSYTGGGNHRDRDGDND